ncbi:OprO/OprP family phosphate-selective porin [Lutibacter sp.]
MNKTALIILSLCLLTLNAHNIVAQETIVNTILTDMKINGRIQYDFEFLKRENDPNQFNENEFRRVHFSVAGKVSPSIKYKVEVDFAHASLGFRDVYIKYVSKKYGNFAVGSIAEPTGLDMMTSSKYMPFFERAMLTSLQNFRWGSGFHYENFGLFKGTTTLQMAVTNNGLNSEGFFDANLETGSNFIARATHVLLNNKEKNQLIHIGVNFANRPNNTDLKFRPENHLGAKYHYVIPDAGRRTETGVELGTTFGSFSVQSEYKSQTYDAASLDYSMKSYYALASYFITGEHRPYKHAAFARVKPKKDIDNKGIGAIEVLLRYSSMKASDAILAVPDNAGLPSDVNIFTIGLNWYLTSHVRVMYNFSRTDDGNTIDGKLTGHLIRCQLDF